MVHSLGLQKGHEIWHDMVRLGVSPNGQSLAAMWLLCETYVVVLERTLLFPSWRRVCSRSRLSVD